MTLKNKKSQANILVMILVILMILVLMIVIWNIVYSNVKQSGGKVSIEQFKVKLAFDKENAVTIEGEEITVRVHRGTGKGDLKAIKFIFKNDNGDQEIIEITTNLPEELETKPYTFDTSTILGVADITKVSFVPMFEDDNSDDIYGMETDDEEVNTCDPESGSTTCGIWQCGTKKNNCGTEVNCGTPCSPGDTCEEGICVEEPCANDIDCDLGEVCNEEGVCVSLIPLENLVSWWKLDGNANDEEEENDGTAEGGVSFTNEDIRGQVAVFDSLDGSDDRIEIASSVVNDYPFTFSAWMKTNNPSSTTTIVSMGNLVYYNYNRIFIYGALSGNPVGAQAQMPGTGNANIATSSTNVVAGEWYHVVGVFTEENRIIYLNAESSVSETLLSFNFNDMEQEHVTIGKNNYNNGYYEHFYGLIDDVMIFNKALTPEEVTALYDTQNKE